MVVARVCVTVGLGIGVLALGTEPASAGGSSWKVGADHYEVGDTAFAWAPVAWEHNPALGTPEDGPYVAYIVPFDPKHPMTDIARPDALEVAQIGISLEPFDAGGILFGPHHATIEFVVPDVPDGLYSIGHCNSPCTTTLGDLTFGILSIGPEPVPIPTPPPATAPPTTAAPPPSTAEVEPIARRAPAVEADTTSDGTGWGPYALGAAAGALLGAAAIAITRVRTRASSTVPPHDGSDDT